MATLEEILAQVGLGDAGVQTKTASQASPTTKEVNDVLDGLGLSGLGEDEGGVTKTASDERNQMGLTDIYEDMFGEKAPAAPAPEQTKVAAEVAPVAATVTEDEAGQESPVGELTGIYFNVMHDAWQEKLAGDLEAEAGAGVKPQASAPGGGELSKIVGKEGDPAIAMNHDASGGKALKVNPGNQTPYSLKEKALAKAIARRGNAVPGGQITE